MISLFDSDKDFKALAIDKINKELKEFHGDKYGNAVHTYVANVLRDFCGQDERFAEVVYKTKRTLSDCCIEIMKGCGSHISDIEVYRRATKMYFPNSEIEGVMKIIITGELPDAEYLSKEGKLNSKEEAPEKKKEKVKNKSKIPQKPKESEIIQLTLF